MAGLLKPDTGFVALHPEVVQALGSTAANVLSYIAYVESDTGAELKVSQISEGTGVSVSTVKRVTSRLREQGLLTAERADPWHSELTWHVAWDHPVIAGHNGSVNVELSGVPECSPRETQDGTPLLSEQEEHQEPPDAAAPAPPPEEPQMHVPASYQEPLLPAVDLAVVPVDSGPPKNAGTLVARWCDGYRATNGHDAPGPLMKRVAGHMKQLAKACGESHEDWVAAYGAAYDAGKDGRWDPVGYMSRRQRRERTTNVFARPELGGPGPDAVAAMNSLLTITPGQLSVKDS